MTDHLTPSAHAITFALDSTKSAPLYQQLSESLRKLVLTEKWPADSAIPSERELMRMTGLSRMTVRQAIDALTREGLLQRIHGRGTFIIPERIDQDMNGVFSFSKQIQAQGRNLTTRVIEAVECAAQTDDARVLGLADGAPIYRLTRLRFIDGEPMVVNVVRCPAHLFPGLLELDLTESLYGLWTNEYCLPPIQSVDTLESIGAPRDIAVLLGMRTGAPLSLVNRVACTHGNVPIELTDEYARSDRLRYRIQQWALPLVDSAKH